VAASTRLYAAVAAGSALGALARFLCSLALTGLLGPAFPWGTLAVNGLGSFLIGLYATVSEPGGRLRAGPAWRHFVIAGFCGGFTTFSIFSLETLLLVEARRSASPAHTSRLRSSPGSSWCGSAAASARD
jgi:fluoride exporter